MKKLPADTTVVVGMSGGVDSSVAALLLKKQGYKVLGMFMKNWEEKDENGICQSAGDFEDVARVCDRLEIPYYSVEFINEYRDHVFAEFLREYQAGYTPNPDILCNREIKFNFFLKKALSLGADYLATGHYAQVAENLKMPGQFELLKGKDQGKDQSYFLYTLKSDILKNVLFPIGGLEKSEVRKVAKEAGLSTHAKKDSTGICFIGERNFPEFLGRYIQSKPGVFKTLDGTRVGSHSGVAFYTLGQRKHLGLGGQGEPWYVVGKDVQKNVVLVERGGDHPALFADYLIADEITWVSPDPNLEFPFKCRAKNRYRQSDQACTVFQHENGKLRVVFDEPQRSITPRQSVVFYRGETCVGGAMIFSVGPSYFEQKRSPFKTSYEPTQSPIGLDNRLSVS